VRSPDRTVGEYMHFCWRGAPTPNNVPITGLIAENPTSVIAIGLDRVDAYDSSEMTGVQPVASFRL
jgi:hypothetical protein